MEQHPEWQVEFARLIAFPSSAPIFLEQNWWQEAFGDVPEDFTSIQKKHSREDRGTSDGAILSLTVDLHRIVWLAQPSEDLGAKPGLLPTLGAYRKRIEWFVDLMTPWLETQCPSIHRLAFGAKLLWPVPTSEEAFQVLSRCLPRVDFKPEPNDFQLTINRRTSIDGFDINRVSTWSKMNVLISVEPGAPFDWPDACYSTLEVDINTAPEKKDPIPASKLAALFRNLASTGMQIATNGDVE